MTTTKHPRLRKGDTIVLDGVAIILTGTPKLAIDGSWQCYGVDSTGKCLTKYIKGTEQ